MSAVVVCSVGLFSILCFTEYECWYEFNYISTTAQPCYTFLFVIRFHENVLYLYNHWAHCICLLGIMIHVIHKLNIMLLLLLFFFNNFFIHLVYHSIDNDSQIYDVSCINIIS